MIVMVIHIHDVVKLTITHSCVHGKDINDVDIMVLFAPCVDDNTLAIIHVNLVLQTLLHMHHRNV